MAETMPKAPIPRMVARARLTVDSPERLFAGGFGSLTPPDYEQEWRQGGFDSRTLDRISSPELLLRLADLSPEVSKGLWDFLRFSNAGWELNAYRTGRRKEKTVDERAQAALDRLKARLKALYGSPDVVFNRLFLGAFLRGAFFAEIVLDAAGREPVDVATPDPRWVYFEQVSDPVRGPVYRPYQQQGSRSERVYLDRPTIGYVPVDPLPGSPFGRAMASPAVFNCLFSMGLMRDLRRVVAQQGYPRIDVEIVGENLRAIMPAGLENDPEELKRWVDDLLDQVRREYEALEPDDAYVHTDSTKINRPVGTVDSSSLGAIDGLMRALDRSMVRALKSSPFLFGSSESTTETQATRQYEALQAGIQSIQHLCEHLVEQLLTVGLQAMGIQAEVELRFAVVRAAELLRDTQVEEARMRVAALGWALGYWSQDEAAEYATGKEEADAPAPRALPNTLQPLALPEADRPAGEGPDGEPVATTEDEPDAGEEESDGAEDRARWQRFLCEFEGLFERWRPGSLTTNGRH